MQTTLKARNGPDICRQCKVKLPEGHYKTRCNPCLEKQRTGAAQTRRKRKFEELENVSPDGQENTKKPDTAKVCVNKKMQTDSDIGDTQGHWNGVCLPGQPDIRGQARVPGSFRQSEPPWTNQDCVGPIYRNKRTCSVGCVRDLARVRLPIQVV